MLKKVLNAKFEITGDVVIMATLLILDVALTAYAQPGRTARVVGYIFSIAFLILFVRMWKQAIGAYLEDRKLDRELEENSDNL